MLTRLLHIILILTLIGVLGLSESFAAGNGVSQFEYKMIRLMNQARVNPAKMARFFGMDPEKICKDNPDLKTLFEWGLPPLNFDPILQKASELHAVDMLTRGYYSDVTPEGVGVEERILNAGYIAKEADELLGVILFSNYYEQEKAVNEIFRKMFVGELTNSLKKRRVILGESFSDVGVSVTSGKFIWKGETFNAYIVVCNLGMSKEENSQLRSIQKELLQMINQERSASSNDVAKDALSAFARAYYPFAWLAWADSLDRIIDRDYSDVKPQERPSYRRRMTQFFGIGDSVSFLEGRYEIALPDTDSLYITESLFTALLEEDRLNGAAVLNSDATEAGISVRRDLEWLDGEGRIVYTATLEIGKPAEPTAPVINGVVYYDSDGNGAYSPGEGLADIPVIIFDAGIHLKTDSVGGFESIVSAGEAYRIICFGSDGNLLISETDAINNHKSIFFNVSATGKGGERQH